MTAPLRIFIIAGEPSGDQLGAHLMAGLKAERPGTVFAGVGGALMQMEGLDSLFPMADLSVMGIAEVLPKLPRLLARIRQTAARIAEDRPDILITIDSPDFCLRVARRARAALPGLRTVHYVAPSVWAWRPERAIRMAPVIDHVLALLPFEPPYMQAAGMTCDFVGHPAATFPMIGAADLAAFRTSHDIAADAKLLCLLPGSRGSEIAHHAPVFRDVLARLAHSLPGLRTVVTVAPPVRAAVEAAFAEAPTRPLLIHPGTDLCAKLTAFAAADAALAVSGTVSLELASQDTPMVIAYTTGALSRWIIRRKFLLDTATLVNLVSETRTVPEFIFDRFRADLIAPQVRDYLSDPQQAAAQLSACAVTMDRLGRGGEPPGLRAARSVLDRFR